MAVCCLLSKEIQVFKKLVNSCFPIIHSNQLLKDNVSAYSSLEHSRICFGGFVVVVEKKQRSPQRILLRIFSHWNKRAA